MSLLVVGVQNRLVTTHHVAIPALAVGLVLDGECAHEHLRVTCLSGCLVSLPSDEVRGL